MEVLAALAVAAVMAVGGLVQALRTRQARRDRWAATAAAVGLTDVKVEVTPLSDRLRGRTGTLEVSIEKHYLREDLNASLARRGFGDQGNHEPPAARITVRGLPPALGLRPEGEGAGVFGPRGEAQIGDPAFDGAVYVQGPPALLFALLDPPTRAQVLQAMLWPIEVRDGWMRAAFPEHYAGGGEGDPLPMMMRPMLALAERLRRPSDIVDRLAQHVREEPLDEVRLWNLMTLAREYPEHPATREALHHAAGDPYDEVRLRAAMMLGPEGRPVLLEFARRERGDDTCAARAIEALGDGLGAEDSHEILRLALRERLHLTGRAVMARVARLGDEASLRAVTRVLALEKGDLAEAAALALGGCASPLAEASLVAGLRNPSDFVRAAAARSLGRMGTAAAVLPLREAEEEYPRDAQLRRVAREAVAAIQARSGAASPGQLTLAEGESGRLSLAEGDEGRLSLAEQSRARR
jgi:HEAT repeat protein